MRRWFLTSPAALLALTACTVADSDAATLPPLDSTGRSSAITAPASLPSVPHRAWYYLHRDAIDEQLGSIRALVAELSSSDDPAVLTLVCVSGVDLDGPASRVAYESPDVHPAWIRLVDLTRWMTAGCRHDAARSVADVLPRLDAAESRFEAWIERLARS